MPLVHFVDLQAVASMAVFCMFIAVIVVVRVLLLDNKSSLFVGGPGSGALLRSGMRKLGARCACDMPLWVGRTLKM